MARSKQQTRPMLEGLERKMLLTTSVLPNGRPIFISDLVHQARHAERDTIPRPVKTIGYTTAEGTKVVVNLVGIGTLEGSSVDPTTGALNLVYNNTTIVSRIVGHTRGGTGRAPLASIRNANVLPRSASPTGSTPIDIVNLSPFDLIEGGYISLTGGANALRLASMARDTQVHMTEGLNLTGPVAGQETPPTRQDLGSQVVGGTPTGGVGGANGTGGAPVVGGNTGGAVAIAGPTAVVVPRPTGIEITIPHINAGPLDTPPLGPPMVFGFAPDPNGQVDQLIRFNATTGAAVSVIPVPHVGTPIAGVGLGRASGRLVVLVGYDTTIRAFDVVSGAPVGQFTTANLATVGLGAIDGIGSTDVRTVLTDSKAGTNGMAQVIDVTLSLASGQAVPTSAPFAPQREFAFSGGLTGLPDSNVIYATGAAHFDTFQPDLTQVGILAFSTSGAQIHEISRLPVPGTNTPFINAGPPGTAQQNPIRALGSIDGNLALVTGVLDGHNVVTTYDPSTIKQIGTIDFATPRLMTGLSESFHPELLNAALIDVQGDVENYAGQDASGLVLNASGHIGLVAIKQAIDTAIVGHPVIHVAIPQRRNVEILSSPRVTGAPGTRGGVTVNKTLPPIGPLTLP